MSGIVDCSKVNNDSRVKVQRFDRFMVAAILPVIIDCSEAHTESSFKDTYNAPSSAIRALFFPSDTKS